jgi:energy-coupling factor transporter transmembrane protein EcfT
MKLGLLVRSFFRTPLYVILALAALGGFAFVTAKALARFGPEVVFFATMGSMLAMVIAAAWYESYDDMKREEEKRNGS